MPSVSDQIIDVLEWLADKVGIAIDWTSARVTENIIPYIKELVQRYAIYQIALYGFWSVVGFVLIVVPATFLIKIAKTSYKVRTGAIPNSMWYDSDGFLSLHGFVTTAICIICLLAGLIMFPCCLCAMFKWIFVPEVAMIDTIKHFLPNND